MRDIAPGSPAETALRYLAFMKGKAARTKRPDYSIAIWDELAELVDTAAFVRVGRHGETMRWDETVALMHRSATDARMDFEPRHVTQTGDRVTVAGEERGTRDGATHVFDSLTVFTFDAAGRIHRLEYSIVS